MTETPGAQGQYVVCYWSVLLGSAWTFAVPFFPLTPFGPGESREPNWQGDGMGSSQERGRALTAGELRRSPTSDLLLADVGTSGPAKPNSSGNSHGRGSQFG